MSTERKLELARTTLRNAAKKFAAVSGARRQQPDAVRAAGEELDVAARDFHEAELRRDAEIASLDRSIVE